jgi:hypothetical protein
VPDPTPRRRLSLDDLRNDLAQVAPAQTEEDLDAFAGELRRLLAGPQGQPAPDRALNKQALWERVSAEIDRLNDGSTETSEDAIGESESEPTSDVALENEIGE